MGLRQFSISTMSLLIIGIHLGCHLGYIETLNDARVASLGFFKDNVYSTRISKEKKFKIKFQVLLKLARILPDYKNKRGKEKLPWCRGINLCFVNQGPQVRFPASPSLSDETLSRCPVF